MLKYKVLTHEAKLGKNKGKKVQQGYPVLNGHIEFDKLCESLSKGCTVSKADVKAVLSQMTEKIAEFLDLGMSIDCGELGIFRPSFGSQQVLEKEKFTVENLKKPRVVFTPRKEFKECLKNVGFERVES